MKQASLRTKLAALTTMLLLAVLVVAGIGTWSIKAILSSENQYHSAAELHSFIKEKEVDHLKWIGKIQDLFANNSETLDVQLDHTKCSLGQFLHGEEGEALIKSHPEFTQLMDEFKKSHQKLHESGKPIKEIWHKRHKGLSSLLHDILIAHQEWLAQVSRMVIERNAGIPIQMDHTLCSFGKFLESEQYTSYTRDFPALHTALDAVMDPHEKLHESAREIKARIDAGKYNQAETIYKATTLPSLEIIKENLDKAISAEGDIDNAQAEAYRIYETETLPALTATQAKMASLTKAVEDMKAEVVAETESTRDRSIILSYGVTLAAIVIGVLFSFFLIRHITRPIFNAIEGLTSGSEQMASAAGQVSSASQSLAEGASTQAASIEETSASLEEMTAMTRQNVDNAGEANSLMKTAGQVIAQANGSMQDLTVSMDEISKASQDTSKIIKTIDEIAFQTNLLALNAAVEAARAGEAGAGFAVVADEVRNLAMRAAEAAKETASLIEGTVRKVETGSGLVTNTNLAFQEVEESARKVEELVAEISAASNEQSNGIEQIHAAVIEMDNVVQRNSASAEENAAASEELNAQAESVKTYVLSLTALVGGHMNGNGNDYVKYDALPRLKSEARQKHSSTTSPMEQRGKKPSQITATKRIINPRLAIPMEDDDFKDF